MAFRGLRSRWGERPGERASARSSHCGFVVFASMLVLRLFALRASLSRARASTAPPPRSAKVAASLGPIAAMEAIASSGLAFAPSSSPRGGLRPSGGRCTLGFSSIGRVAGRRSLALRVGRSAGPRASRLLGFARPTVSDFRQSQTQCSAWECLPAEGGGGSNEFREDIVDKWSAKSARLDVGANLAPRTTMGKAIGYIV